MKRVTIIFKKDKKTHKNNEHLLSTELIMNCLNRKRIESFLSEMTAKKHKNRKNIQFFMYLLPE